MNDEEYKRFMKDYKKAFAAGICNNRSEYIRHMLGVSTNGDKPQEDLVPSALQDPTSQENIVDDERSKLASDFDFDKIDF